MAAACLLGPELVLLLVCICQDLPSFGGILKHVWEARNNLEYHRHNIG